MRIRDFSQGIGVVWNTLGRRARWRLGRGQYAPVPIAASSMQCERIREIGRSRQTLEILRARADEHQSRRSQRYARELDQATELFDITAMEASLERFALLLDALDRGRAAAPAEY